MQYFEVDSNFKIEQAKIMNKKTGLIIFIIVICIFIVATFLGIQSTLSKQSKNNNSLQLVNKNSAQNNDSVNKDIKNDTLNTDKSVAKNESKNNLIETINLKIDEKNRTYILEKPADSKNIKNIIVALHGEGDNGEKLQKNLRLSDLVTDNNTIIAYPDGINTQWNDIRVKSEDVDDISFIKELTQNLQNEYKIGKDNTTLIGVSNGGFMVQTIVCKDNTLARNMVSITASLLVNLAEQCTSLPVNSLYILGKKDTVVPYEGGEIVGNALGNVISAQNTLVNASQINKCGEKSEEKESTYFIVQKIVDCPNDGQINLITYVNETHISLPLKVDFSSIIKENKLLKKYSVI